MPEPLAGVQNKISQPLDVILKHRLSHSKKRWTFALTDTVHQPRSVNPIVESACLLVLQVRGTFFFLSSYLYPATDLRQDAVSRVMYLHEKCRVTGWADR